MTPEGVGNIGNERKLRCICRSLSTLGCFAGSQPVHHGLAEFLHIIFHDRPERHRDILPFVKFGHLLIHDHVLEMPDGVVSEEIGILHDRSLAMSLLDRVQNYGVFIKREHLHLSQFVGILERLKTLGSIVGPEPDHGINIRMLPESALCVLLGEGTVCAVS